MGVQSINIAVAEKIASLGSTKVIDSVVETLVTIEINKRAFTLTEALKQYEDTSRELKKIKPDQITFNLDGTKASETFSKTVIESHTKLSTKLTKLEKAIVTATESNNWGDLFNLVKSGGNNTTSDESTKVN